MMKGMIAMYPEIGVMIKRREHESNRLRLRSCERERIGPRKLHASLQRVSSALRCLRSVSTWRLVCPVVGLIITAMLVAGCGASFNSELATPSQARISAQLAAADPGADRFARIAGASSTPSIDRMAYKIGPQDVLDISVFQVPELSTSVQVAETGTINLPLLGEIPAAGKTPEAVERDLTAKLGAKYLQSPQVTVFVKEYNSQRVTVEGAVKKPGVYSIKGGTTLLQSIAMAQGLDSSYDSTVLVFRQTGKQRLAAKFDIDAIKDGKSEDPLISQRDVIVVNSSSTKKAFDNVIRIIPSIGAFVPLML